MSSPDARPKKKPAGRKPPAKKAIAVGKAAAKTATPKARVAKPKPAPAPDENVALSASLIDMAKQIERALSGVNLDIVSEEAQQAMMAALVKLYGAAFQDGRRYQIVQGMRAATSTDVMIACAALLKSNNLQVFELGMWQSWTGR